jgi:flavin-dependent trigonelline monooxygenase, reductase component
MTSIGISADRFREIFRAVPTAVAVVTALGNSQVPYGLTCNAVSAVSLHPPMLLVCVDRSARTLAAIRGSGFFAVNFLAEGAQDVSDRFAGKGDDKFALIEWRAGPGGAPVLATKVTAHVSCRLAGELEAGDHWVLLGRIESGAVCGPPPLLYQQGTYFSIERNLL